MRKAIADGYVIHAIEETVKITVKLANGAVKSLPKRVYDSVHKVGTQLRHIESKAWSPKYAVQNIQSSMRGNLIVEAAENGVEKYVSKNGPGQLLRDLAHMYEKRADPDFKIEWHFDKRSAGKETEYLDAIKDELENVKGGGGKLRSILGIADETKWEEALDAINNKLDEGFIKILSV